MTSTAGVKKRRVAGFSVLNKTSPDIAPIAERLIGLGFDIYGSAGTAKYLNERQVPAQDFAVLTGQGPILRHQVVTLDPHIHGGLLARTAPDLEELEQLAYELIEVVYVGLYDLLSALANPNRTDESVRDGEDMGGVAVISSACKGNKIVICDPADWPEVLRQLEETGDVDAATRRKLFAKAYKTIVLYRLLSANYWSDGGIIGLIGEKCYDLAYGPNPHQQPASLFSTGGYYPLAPSRFKSVGKVSKPDLREYNYLRYEANLPQV